MSMVVKLHCEAPYAPIENYPIEIKDKPNIEILNRRISQYFKQKHTLNRGLIGCSCTLLDLIKKVLVTFSFWLSNRLNILFSHTKLYF